jgi:alkylated DNA repair dioxygenase AlkB
MADQIHKLAPIARTHFSLFTPAPIAGLSYLEAYISQVEAFELLAFVDAQAWDTELKRRCQHYGGRYSAIRPENESAVPEAFWPLARRLHRDGYVAQVPNRVSINEYQPGQGIGAHRDREPERIKEVAIISLISGITMDFTRMGHESQSYYLHPLSLLVMRDEARDRWEHGIAPRHNDKVGGVIVPRGRRVSVMFRFAARAYG